MRILGADPGMTTTGYAVIERAPGGLRPISVGVIRTDPQRPGAARLAELRRSYRSVLVATSPDAVAIERVFFNANVKTAMSVGQASGVILATSAERGLEVFDYTPTQVKQAVVGAGDAGKKQVQSMVAALLGLERPPEPPDAADACALAICHLNRSPLAGALRRQGVAG